MHEIHGNVEARHPLVAIMTADREKLNLPEDEAHDKESASSTKDFNKLVKRVNRIADRAFFVFVILCGFVLFVAWITNN